jgi:fatty acid desaturase
MDTHTLNQEPGGAPAARIPWRAVVQFLVLVALLIAVPFVAAGRLDWWGGWAYVILTVLAVVGSRALILRFNPDLAAERATS